MREPSVWQQNYIDLALALWPRGLSGRLSSFVHPLSLTCWGKKSFLSLSRTYVPATAAAFFFTYFACCCKRRRGLVFFFFFFLLHACQLVQLFMSCYGHKSPPFALYRVKRRENKKKKEPSVSLVRNIYTEYEQPFLLMASAEWLNLYFFSLSLFYTSILWPVSFQMKKKKKNRTLGCS